MLGGVIGTNHIAHSHCNLKNAPVKRSWGEDPVLLGIHRELGAVFISKVPIKVLHLVPVSDRTILPKVPKCKCSYCTRIGYLRKAEPCQVRLFGELVLPYCKLL